MSHQSCPPLARVPRPAAAAIAPSLLTPSLSPPCGSSDPSVVPFHIVRQPASEFYKDEGGKSNALSLEV